MDDDLFTSSGIWLRGNLHCHSTNSDGRLTPEEVVEYYSHCGYDFISLTDHEKITRANSKSLLLIPGTEIVAGRATLGDSYHVMALNVEDNETIQKRKLESVDSILEYVADVDGFSFIAHPYWSSLTTSDLSNLQNCLGIEVYNTGCDVLVARGFSSVHWDNLLAQGKRFHGLAVDDAHWYPVDSAGGWIWVKAKERSVQGIVDAIKEGRFYSTMGPSIDCLCYSDGRFEARFSPASRVDVVSEDGLGFSASFDTYEKMKSMKNDLISVAVNENEEGGEEITVELGTRKAFLTMKDRKITHVAMDGASFKEYLRLEITDSNGKKAWGNALFLQNASAACAELFSEPKGDNGQ
mgnify:CR=1 FL=1